VVGDDAEVRETGEEHVAFLDGPCDSHKFQFNDCVSRFCVRYESQAGLNEGPDVLLLQNEA
jgi:hypothetical protein